MIHTRIFITAFLAIFLLAGCGSSNPGSTANPLAKPQGGGGTVTLALNFPIQNTNAPVALISAQTQSFNINIYSVPAYNRIGHAVVVKPAGGGTVSSNIELTPYTGSAAVIATGYDGPDPTRANAKSWMWQDINIPANQQTTPVSMAVVEYGQGALIPAGTPNNTLISPDGTVHTITSIYLDTNNVVLNKGSYILGVNTSFTTLAGASTTTFSSWNTFNLLSAWYGDYIINGQLTGYDGYGTLFNELDIEVPNASGTSWNNYGIKMNFNNGIGATPTNTPTIQTFYWGTYVLNASGAIVAAPAASGTPPLNTIFMNASSAWINNVAPPHASQSVILFYSQPQQNKVVNRQDIINAQPKQR